MITIKKKHKGQGEKMTKYCSVYICLLVQFFVHFNILSAQPLNIDSRFDGSINYSEIQDSEDWKTIEQSDFVIIQESSNAYYLGIKSNIYTSANVYIKDEGFIQILHISYSLGDIKYRNQNGLFIATDSIYQWKFRDPVIRNNDSSQTINIVNELKNFYVKNNWVANTMPIGSYRELEIIISKQLLPSIKNLGLSFLANDEKGERKLHFYPNTIKSVSGDEKIDRQIQNGNLPEVEKFEIFTNKI